MIVKLPDLRSGYVKLVTWLLETGDRVESRAGLTVERTGVTLLFEDPTTVMLPVGVGRKINPRLAAVETLQLISGTSDGGELIRRAAPTYDDVLLDPQNVDYAAYGLRLRYQLEGIYQELKANPLSRRAVLAIWREEDLYHDGDRPCTLSLQFLIRNDALELHVTMRSQDAWLGTPYDAFMFTQLQRSYAAALDVSVGKYVHHVGSLHLYERNVNAASGLAVSAPTDATNVLRDYPAGILTTGDDDFFPEVAAYMLEGNASDDELTLNAWYARQLAQLGVGRRSSV